MNREAAERLAAALDLDVHDMAICLACLSFVSCALDRRDEHEVRREVNRVTPDLWAEGLELPVRMALERASERGVRHAEAGLAEVRVRGARSSVAKAVVRRLGGDLAAHADGDLLELGCERWPSADAL